MYAITGYGCSNNNSNNEYRNHAHQNNRSSYSLYRADIIIFAI